MSKAKEVLLFELEEQMHPARVEDVIFLALEYYYKDSYRGTWGEIIAYSIVRAIKEAEGKVKPFSLDELKESEVNNE